MKVFKKLSMCILSGLLCLGIGATTQAATKTGTNVYEMNMVLCQEKIQIKCNQFSLFM